MRSRLGCCVILSGLLLSACGSTPEERAATGAMIGAAGGVVGGAIVGAPLVGAALGATAGAAVGAITPPSQVDLGKPIWK